MVLKSFVLVGIIVSHDEVFSTVKFNLNPATNAGPAIAVMPNKTIPCEVKAGKKIYVVKDKNMKIPTITCELDTQITRSR